MKAIVHYDSSGDVINYNYTKSVIDYLLHHLGKFLLYIARPHYISEVLCSHSIVSSSRTVRPYSPWEVRWIGHWRTTWSTVCYSVPYSQAAEDAIPKLHKHEWKRLTLVQRQLSQTHAVLGRVILGVWVPGKKVCSLVNVVQPLHLPLVIRPVHYMYVVVVKWTNELLCGDHNRYPDLRCCAFTVNCDWFGFTIMITLCLMCTSKLDTSHKA